MKSNGQISIKVGKLTEALATYRVKKGTTLASFAESHEIELDSAVRVNGEVVAKSYTLRVGDIITIVGDVSGGI
jgi:sulfur carrier protein ThiS